MPDFKFVIGEFVYLRTAVTDSFLEADLGFYRLPKSLIITARRMEECSGGVQFLYVISSGAGSYNVHQLELISIDDFDHTQYMRRLSAGVGTTKDLDFENVR